MKAQNPEIQILENVDPQIIADMKIRLLESNLLYVIVERAEGPIELCGSPKVFKTLDDADAYLDTQNHTFLSDKHDITLVTKNSASDKFTMVCKNPKHDFYKAGDNSIKLTMIQIFKRSA